MYIVPVWVLVMIKSMLGPLIKVSAVMVTMLSAESFLGLPIGNNWFDGYVCGVSVMVLGGAWVGGMMEPDETSSRAYCHFYRTAHLIFQRGTTYFLHKSKWHQLVEGDESKRGHDL